MGILVNVLAKRSSFSKSFRELLANKDGKCGRANATVTYEVNEAVIRVANRLRAFCAKEAVAIPQTGGWILSEKKFKELWALYETGQTEISAFNQLLVDNYDKNRADFKQAQSEYLNRKFTKAKARKLLDTMMRDYPSKLALISSEVQVLCDFGGGSDDVDENTAAIVKNSVESQAIQIFYSTIARNLTKTYEIAAKIAEQHKKSSVAARTLGTIKIASNDLISFDEAQRVSSTEIYKAIFVTKTATAEDLEANYLCDNFNSLLFDADRIKAAYDKDEWADQFVSLVKKYRVSEKTAETAISEGNTLEGKAMATGGRCGEENVPEYSLVAQLSKYVADNPDIADLLVKAIFTWSYKHNVEDSLPKIKLFDLGELMSAASAGAYDIRELYDAVLTPAA